MAAGLLIQVLIVRSLTRESYGAFAYALSIETSLRAVVSFGESQALTRFLALYEERGEDDKLLGTLVMAAAKIVLSAVVLIPGLYALRGVMTGSFIDDPDAVALLLILAFLAPIEALDRLVEGAFAVFSRPSAIFVRKYVVAPGLRLLVVLALVFGGAGPRFLAFGYVAAGAAGMALYAAALVRLLRQRGVLRRLRSRKLSLPFRDYFGFSVPLLTTELVNISLMTVSVVILGRVAGVTAVAGIRAILPAARLNQVVLFTFTLLFVPMAARLFARDDRPGMRDAYWQCAVWLAVFSFPVFALTGPLAEPVTTALFGERYAGASAYLALLSAGYYFNAALGFNLQTIQAWGGVRWLVTVNGVAVIMSVALSLALIPSFGAMGMAVGNAVTLVAMNVLNQLGLRRVTGVPLFAVAYAPVYAAIVVSAALLWLLQVIVEPPLALAIVLAAAASLAVLVAGRRQLRLGDTFPELASLPILRWLA